MGIPSYYKKLCDRIPGLLNKVRGGKQPTHLWVDFNCMVYHCLRRPGARPYGGEETRIQWEDQLIQEVCKYLKKVVGIVGPTDQVFVGVDGVVPMAKMRQQRLRRFKSHWTAAEEVRIGKSDGSARWDTNAITPGTAFMERLGSALQGIKSPGLKWVVSTADEPGEGEHKVMAALRAVTKKESHVVYGLDADLIVLSMLQDVGEMWLFREAVECGEVQYNAFDEEEYRWFSVHKLREVLCAGRDADYLLDYCMALSLVGNDFLPHGLTLKLKDGGHEILLEMLEKVRGEHGSLINTSAGQWNREALLACVQWLAARETGWMVRHVSGKFSQRHSRTRGTTPLEHAVDEWNKMPLRVCEELAIIKSYSRVQEGTKQETKVILGDTWREVYNERWLGASCLADVECICHEYCVGLDWILQYYTGKDVDREWCFPWFVPPLWSDLAAWIQRTETLPRASGATTPQIKPQEQLALVLPLQSWWLIRDAQLRRLPRLAPQLWPSTFKLFTAGRKQTWECEAHIPLFMPERLRMYLAAPKAPI